MTPLDPIDVERALAAYYDQEGDERMHRPVDPRRVELRDGFIGSLPGRRCSVLEIGSGPGRDAPAFLDAGHRHVAVDLSIEHARRCRATGSTVALASVRHLPFLDASFDAVWTMSTLMHVPNGAIRGALAEVARVLRPGGLAAVGVWGGPDVEDFGSGHDEGGKPHRLFSRRSDERWKTMLAQVGEVEAYETWGDGDDFVYQWAAIRRPGRVSAGSA